PLRSAAATRRNAVVEAAASYGASMMATVSVWAMAVSPSMPEGLGVRMHDQIDERVDRRFAHAARDLAGLDAALAQREVVGKPGDARLRQPGDVRATRTGAGREDAVLHEVDRHRAAAGAERRRRVRHERGVSGVEWIA